MDQNQAVLLDDNDIQKKLNQQVNYKYVFIGPILQVILFIVIITIAFLTVKHEQHQQNCYKEPFTSADQIECKNYLMDINNQFLLTALLITTDVFILIPIHISILKVNKFIQHFGFLSTTNKITITQFTIFISTFCVFCIIAIIMGQVRTVDWNEKNTKLLHQYIIEIVEQNEQLHLINCVFILILITISVSCIIVQIYFMIYHNMQKDQRDFKNCKQSKRVEKIHFIESLKAKMFIQKQLTVMEILKSQQEVASKDILIQQQQLQQFEIFNQNVNISQLTQEKQQSVIELEQIKLRFAQVNNQLQQQKITNTQLKASHQHFEKIVKSKQ